MKSFEGGAFSYDGKLFKIPETTVFPQPVQKPHPPIWITAQSPDSLEAAVRRGFNVLTGGFGVSIERLAEFRRLFDKAVAEVTPPHPLQIGDGLVEERSEEHTSELQSHSDLVCRLLLEKKKKEIKKVNCKS